ncbi:DsbA family protein [Microbacterium halophytorum]|uniref:DsbA family protein n=1 Tax=Microbacterium halophytorum TaxID=2067568 RepID=UPI000CFD876D|nr:thioredoxin domain-containing protein [Microbacterium halophytorum]
MSNRDRGPSDDRPEADDVEGAEQYDADASLAEADDTADAASAAERRVAVRQKAKRVSTKQRVRKVVVRVVIVLVVIAALVAAGLWIRQTVVTEVTKPAVEPFNAPEGAFVFDDKDLSSMLDDGADAEPTEAPEEESSEEEPSDDEAPERVRVDVYVDYLSPESGLFHTSNAAQLAKWVEEDAISLTYHPVALLTAKSNGTRYSERAMGAAGCVASGDAGYIVAYNDALLTEQPEVDTPGLTSEELAELASEVGVENPDVGTCIETDKYADWARETTSALSEGGLPGQSGQQLTGAPTILVNDQPYTGALDDPGELSQFVLTIESSEFYESPSPAPTE